jgi:aryl-alcohol dehydrogenase-like predicted oxidoreductase
MQTRPFGKTGQNLSIIGFGGICVTDVESHEAEMMVGKAFDAGINYFDVAPSYGNAQERLGPALKPFRDEVFLACKTGLRTKDAAQAQLHESLKLLRTDHIDLYQFHGVTRMEEVETILAPGGAMEAFLEARDKGDIRFIGFSAHSEEAAIALLDRFNFDSVMFPINWAAWLAKDFGPAVIKKAQDRNTAIVAIKALAKRSLEPGEPKTWQKEWYVPVESYREAQDGLRFTLSQPVIAAISPGQWELLQWALEAAENFTPMSEDEMEELRERAQRITPVFPLPIGA